MPRFNELLAGQEVELQKRDPNSLKVTRGAMKITYSEYPKKPRIRNNSPHFAAVTITWLPVTHQSRAGAGGVVAAAYFVCRSYDHEVICTSLKVSSLSRNIISLPSVKYDPT
jgi:hypothetical protein